MKYRNFITLATLLALIITITFAPPTSKAYSPTSLRKCWVNEKVVFEIEFVSEKKIHVIKTVQREYYERTIPIIPLINKFPLNVSKQVYSEEFYVVADENGTFTIKHIISPCLYVKEYPNEIVPKIIPVISSKTSFKATIEVKDIPYPIEIVSSLITSPPLVIYPLESIMPLGFGGSKYGSSAYVQTSEFKMETSYSSSALFPEAPRLFIITITPYEENVTKESSGNMWEPYFPKQESVLTSIFKEGNYTYLKVSITLPHGGFKIDWGELIRENNVFKINVDLYEWQGPAIQIIMFKEKSYNLGCLKPGNYTIKLFFNNMLFRKISFQVQD
ncbi:MAG: hypothetical protein B6U76_02020 [Desulfurococcales archaeon ex4484_217_2]|nr:MAG: hypothetical protein B6U76_02020 [Desulfurococcales archaeon ex4484_217_2]